MTDIALVTGATGFIGSHLVDKLLAEGTPVRCLVRGDPPYQWLDDGRIDLVRGDCTQIASLGAALKGVGVVYHIAGVTWSARSADYERTNVSGTRNLLEAIPQYAPDLSRFVYVSSQAAGGPTRGGIPRTLSDPDIPVTPYGRSKLAAEKEVLARKRDIHCVILRPSAVYGPRDRSFLPIFKLMARKILIQFGSEDRLVSFCHVSDLVSAIVAAGQKAVSTGSIYYVSEPEPRYWSDIESIIASEIGVTPRKVVLSTTMLKILGYLGQFYGTLFSRPVQLNRARLQELLENDWSLAPSNLWNDLGVRQKFAVDTAMQELVRWYRRNNWL
jgi:dihydroflavonol-4-reductase